MLSFCEIVTLESHIKKVAGLVLGGKSGRKFAANGPVDTTRLGLNLKVLCEMVINRNRSGAKIARERVTGSNSK